MPKNGGAQQNARRWKPTVWCEMKLMEVAGEGKGGGALDLLDLVVDKLEAAKHEMHEPNHAGNADDHSGQPHSASCIFRLHH